MRFGFPAQSCNKVGPMQTSNCQTRLQGGPSTQPAELRIPVDGCSVFFSIFFEKNRKTARQRYQEREVDGFHSLFCLTGGRFGRPWAKPCHFCPENCSVRRAAIPAQIWGCDFCEILKKSVNAIRRLFRLTVFQFFFQFFFEKNWKTGRQRYQEEEVDGSHPFVLVDGRPARPGVGQTLSFLP